MCLANFKPRKVHYRWYRHDVLGGVRGSERVCEHEEYELDFETSIRVEALAQLRSGLVGAGGGCSMNIEMSARGSTALLMLLCRAVVLCVRCQAE